MKLSSKNWLVRWAYLDHGKWELPERTTVCALFFRAFVLSPLMAVMMLVVIAIAAPCVGLVKGWDWLVKKLNLERELHLPEMPAMDLVGQRIADWKNKVCTTVEID